MPNNHSKKSVKNSRRVKKRSKPFNQSSRALSEINDSHRIHCYKSQNYVSFELHSSRQYLCLMEWTLPPMGAPLSQASSFIGWLWLFPPNSSIAPTASFECLSLPPPWTRLSGFMNWSLCLVQITSYETHLDRLKCQRLGQPIYRHFFQISPKSFFHDVLKNNNPLVIFWKPVGHIKTSAQMLWSVTHLYLNKK